MHQGLYFFQQLKINVALISECSQSLPVGKVGRLCTKGLPACSSSVVCSLHPTVVLEDNLNALFSPTYAMLNLPEACEIASCVYTTPS